ncbi:MAG TPA: MBL fold metallo-hydrolase [Candidatus Aphodocola excrementigallinarum]|uniref:MBL fold metallo-hydrolase n=1 Tax=Candidatus Aphodocola excrementigallinarum TaxID=2840670 RepID=A0A9D1IR10_9FIRM|nr:MBL fold metallo-hydrolase [Candidatus Aphodocola excrementigallinarum]
MKNEKKIRKIISIIIGIIIVLFILLNGDFISNATASVSNINNSNENNNVDGSLSVHFIDVGQGDCIYINQGEYNMLIDAGNNEDGEKLVSYLKSLNVNGFDYVIGTHPHEDHIGGMDDIINNFEIENYYMPDKLSTTKTFEDVLDALDAKDLSYNVPKIDDEFKLGDATFKVIYSGDDTNDINDSSIVLKMTYGDNSFLFTGDATSNVEEIILNKDIKSDVLKVAHHGSSYSSTTEFLDKVNPKYAVISVGKNNSYNHPASITLQKLSNRDIKVYRTDLDGTIIFTSDGTNLSVQTNKTDTNG